MGFIRVCVCSLLLFVSLAAIGACSGDDSDGSSGGAACHCEWGDTCDELSSGCSSWECESDEGNAKASGACSQTDVIGSCDCSDEGMVTYYRSSFTGDPVEDCEFWCGEGAYEPL